MIDELPTLRRVSAGWLSCRELANHSLGGGPGSEEFSSVLLLKLGCSKLTGYEKPCVSAEMPVIKILHVRFLDMIQFLKSQHQSRGKQVNL